MSAATVARVPVTLEQSHDRTWSAVCGDHTTYHHRTRTDATAAMAEMLERSASRWYRTIPFRGHWAVVSGDGTGCRTEILRPDGHAPCVSMSSDDEMDGILSAVSWLLQSTVALCDVVDVADAVRWIRETHYLAMLAPRHRDTLELGLLEDAAFQRCYRWAEFCGVSDPHRAAGEARYTYAIVLLAEIDAILAG